MRERVKMEELVYLRIHKLGQSYKTFTKADQEGSQQNQINSCNPSSPARNTKKIFFSFKEKVRKRERQHKKEKERKYKKLFKNKRNLFNYLPLIVLSIFMQIIPITYFTQSIGT